jgi:pyrophosphate--fructose-6-phosphate 1-phosphotransferase
MPKQKIAMLTAGGLAPCLSSAVGGLIERYSAVAPEAEMIGYRAGYMGLLKGDSIPVTAEVRKGAAILHRFGGSPIGNSRVKLSNVADCVKRGLVKEGEVPLAKAAEQLVKDGVTILHTIGGDDTNTTAAELAAYLSANGYKLTVVGLPKTVDNDVVPIKQSLGADTAAEQGALFFENVINEGTTNPRMLLIHEVMGRNCGWLTAATALAYRKRMAGRTFLPSFQVTPAKKDVDAIYVPEMAIDIPAEAARLRRVMDEKGSVAIFVSEGAGVGDIVAEMTARGETVERDAFGHVKLDTINVGNWFSKQFAKLVAAEKTLVQKSGYFARSSAANNFDLELIATMVELAVTSGLGGKSGVIGHDEERGGELRVIEFPRIKGGKPFDISTPWFTEMLRTIGQPVGGKVEVAHAEE